MPKGLCLFARSPNIKFGIYSRKDKSKIFIFSYVINRNVSLITCPTFLILNVVKHLEKLNWKELNNDIYFWDGSWRDIFIPDTDRNDWKIFVDFINERFDIKWFNENTQKTETKINFDRLIEFWDKKIDWNNTANIYLDNIQINTHFFTEDEIECDIDPREFNGINDHEKLMEFLTELSNRLNKRIKITPENCPEIELVGIEKNNVSINLNSPSDSWPIRIKK
ncbi:hypothetical protein KO500_00645 [Cellulophaga baltica]|uniref:hypothetical protein n=1 Tax=Cellulophaga TaxID=104264 RepID=UPI001C07C2A6|nr:MULTISPECIES: hypothetical protein [Cellulophaga]MBU2994920.1 hypothetical protein [Cellulophaga baltica]MDO6766314.1 hypothetical protein [Cellulophaga sp. 1_MG-2023]